MNWPLILRPFGEPADMTLREQAVHFLLVIPVVAALLVVVAAALALWNGGAS